MAASNRFSMRLLCWRVLAVVGALLLLAFVVAPHFRQASEDAIILFQYSQNLARTGVISFIPHGPRAEGATDFLWMVWLAAGRFLGIPSYGLAVASSALCAVALAALLVRLAHQRMNGWNVLATLCLVLLAPQTFAAEAGFSVFAFAIVLALMVAAAFYELYGWAALFGLLLCLVRPDGVVFAVPLLVVYLFRGTDRVGRAVKFGLLFVLPGLIYFAWRWHYFGHMLPLPFYVKSDTPRLFGLVVGSSAEGLMPPLIAGCALVYAALRGDAWLPRNRVLLLTLLLPSSLFYLAMRLDQNYADRFFLYPLVVAAVVIAGNFASFQQRAGKVLLEGFGIWLILLAYFWVNWFVIYGFEYPQPQEVAVARALAEIPGRGTMIVSESGAIPFYSQWHGYDPWGLNTPAFALHLIQPQDVKTLAPDLVILHQQAQPVPCALEAGSAVPYHARTWDHMTQNVIAGIDPQEYTQWLLPQFNAYYRAHPTRWNGKPRWGNSDFQCWFVRKDYAHAKQVEGILKENGGVSAEAYVKRMDAGTSR